MLHLFHGSPVRIPAPSPEKCRANNDYGRGFYCTQHPDLAKEWACQKGVDGFCNEYLLDESDLVIVDLNGPGHNILNWLAVLSENRIINAVTPVMQRGQKWLAERFSVDLTRADIVKGYRADDSYFAFTRAFLRNEITLDQLSEAMHLGALGEQFMVKSPAAFAALRYQGATPAESAAYWPLRNRRDQEARARYQRIAAGPTSRKPALYLANLMDMEEGDLYALLR